MNYIKLSIILITVIGATEAKAQAFGNKKATAVQNFTLKLTMPAAAQIDIQNAANNYLNGISNKPTKGQTGKPETPKNNLKITAVATVQKTNPVLTTEEPTQQPEDKFQLITLSNA